MADTAPQRLHSRELAAHLFRLADFLGGAALSSRAIPADRWSELERQADEVRQLAVRLHDMKAELVDARTVQAFKSR
jgi:hypothetical protein